MTPDSYLSLFAVIVILSWWPIIILFYYHYVYIIICLLHGEELYNNLFISNFKFSVNFFFHRFSTVMLQ